MANIIEDVVYIIGAKDMTDAAYSSAKAGLASLNDKSKDIAAQMDNHWQAFKKNWLGVTAAFWAGLELLKKAWNMAEAAAAYNEHMQLIDGLAKKFNTSAPEIVNRIREIGDGLLSLAATAETVDSAMTKGLSPDMLYGLAEASVVLGDSMKMTADEAFKALSEAMETGKERSIKLAVGVIDLKDRYGEMAAKMTEAEKQAALYNIIMEKTREIQARTSGETKSTADRMESLGVIVRDLQLQLGQGLLRAGASAMGVFQLLASGALTLVQAYANVLGMIHSVREALSWGASAEWHKKAVAEYKAIAAAAAGAAAELAGKSAESFAVMTASTAELQRATAGATAATQQHAASIGEREKAIAANVKALEALGSVMRKYGEDMLKMAKEELTSGFKGQSQDVVALRANLEKYLTTVQTVYAARISGEKAVAAEMVKVGAHLKDQLEAAAQILKTEKEGLTARLDGWKTYYDALAAKHAEATNLMKQKTGELAAIEAKIAAERVAQINWQADSQVKLMQAQGKALDDITVKEVQRTAAEKLYANAMEQTGQERIDGLKQYIDSIGKTSGAEKEYYTKKDIWTLKDITYTKDITTAEQNQLSIIAKQSAAYNQINDELAALKSAKDKEIDQVKTWQEALNVAMLAAKKHMDEYQQKINQISQTISEMDKTIALTVETEQASAALAGIQAQLNGIQSKSITVTVNYATAEGSGGSGSGDGGITTLGGVDGYDDGGDGGITTLGGVDGYAKGAAFGMGDVIPFASGDIFSRPTYFPMSGGRTGMLGEGGTPEAVMPLKRGRDGRLGVAAEGGQTVTFAPGSIVINGGQKSGEQLAEEIVRYLPAKLKDLKYMVR